MASKRKTRLTASISSAFPTFNLMSDTLLLQIASICIIDMGKTLLNRCKILNFYKEFGRKEGGQN